MPDVLSRERIEEWRRSFSGGSIDFHALCDMALSALDDAEDAERYRWIRELPNANSLSLQFCGVDLDVVVDEARKEATK